MFSVKEQARGRIARHRRGVHVNIGDKNEAEAVGSRDQCTSTLQLPSTQILAMTLCMHALKVEDCIPDYVISSERMRTAEDDLAKLGCCRRADDGQFCLTALGVKIAMQGDLNVQSEVFLYIAEALGVGGHAHIARAYMHTESSNIELFFNVLPTATGLGPLLPSQIALGVVKSDFVAAVNIFLKYKLGTLSRDDLLLVRLNCLKQMQKYLDMRPKLNLPEPQELAETIDWQAAVVFSHAFAFRTNIMYGNDHTDGLMTAHIQNDPVRRGLVPPLGQPNKWVQISNRSVCSPQSHHPKWFVYSSTARGNTVKGVSEIPQIQAVYFSKLAHTCPETSDATRSFEKAVVNRIADFPCEAFPEELLQMVRPKLFDVWTLLNVQPNVTFSDASTHARDQPESTDAEEPLDPETYRQHRETFRCILGEFQELLDKYYIDNSDDAWTLVVRKIRKEKPRLLGAVDALRTELEQAEFPGLDWDAVKENRRTAKRVIALALKNVKIKAKAQNIKAYMFNLSMDALHHFKGMQTANPDSTLTLENQLKIFQDVMNPMTSAAEFHDIEGVDNADPNVSERRAAIPDAKAALKGAKETLDRWGELSTITFQGLKRKIREEEGGTDVAINKKANQLWEHSGKYLKRDLFWVDGEKKTEAKAYSDWMRQGFTHLHCQDYWKRIRPRKCGNEIKALDPSYAQPEQELLIKEKLESRAWRRVSTPERS